MKFAIADTFQRSLARLNGDEQTRAKAAVFDFHSILLRRDSRTSGFNERKTRTSVRPE